MYIYRHFEDFFVRFLYNPDRYLELNAERLALLFECFLESYLQRQHNYLDYEILGLLLNKITEGSEGVHDFDDNEEFETFTPDYVTDFICHSLVKIIVHDEDKGNKVRELVFNYFKVIYQEELKNE